MSMSKRMTVRFDDNDLNPLIYSGNTGHSSNMSSYSESPFDSSEEITENVYSIKKELKLLN